MKRKLLAIVLLLGAAFHAGAQGKDDYARFEQWKGRDKVVVFPLVTDVHANYTTRKFWDCISRDIATDTLFHYDFMANLGDVCTKMSDQVLEDTASRMLGYDGVWIYLPGNHDYDGQDRRYTEQELSSALLDPFMPRAKGRLHRVEGESYGWYDIPQKKTRVIFLDSMQTGTTGGKYYTYGTAQLEWLSALLRSTRRKWNVVVLSHFMPHKNYGLWNPEKELGTSTFDETLWQLQPLLAEFVEGGGRLVGLFCGDAHCNAFDCIDGVNMYVSQGLGGYPNECIREGIRYVPCNFNRDFLLDVVAFKPRTREVAIFRLGKGGKQFDRKFRY